MKALPLFALLLLPCVSWAQEPRTVPVSATAEVPPTTSDLMNVVNALRQAQIPDVVTTSRSADGRASSTSSKPAAKLLAFINNKPASDAELNALTLQQVREVALRFDPTYLTLYGSVGAKGIIKITTK